MRENGFDFFFRLIFNKNFFLCFVRESQRRKSFFFCFLENPAGGLRWSKEEEEAKSRRAAEREGRRTRRRRTRELKSLSSSHIDGMSSDDELTESELTAFKLKLGINFMLF